MCLCPGDFENGSSKARILNCPRTIPRFVSFCNLKALPNWLSILWCQSYVHICYLNCSKTAPLLRSEKCPHVMYLRVPPHWQIFRVIIYLCAILVSFYKKKHVNTFPLLWPSKLDAVIIMDKISLLERQKAPGLYRHLIQLN